MTQPKDRRQFVLHGAIALLGARIAALPAGEWTIQIDLRHPGRPRWRIQPAPEWEHERAPDEPRQAGRQNSQGTPEDSRKEHSPQR